MRQVWLIFGCSTGLGRALVDELVLKGHAIVGLTRHPDALPKEVLTVSSDLVTAERLSEAAALAMKTYGRIDVLVNNAGYGAFGKVQDISATAMQSQFEVNFFACANLMRLVIPIMTLQGSGRILNVSSIGALHPFPESGAYNATKAALSALSQSADQELDGTGVRSINVMPGQLRTEFKGDNFHAYGDSDGIKGFVSSAGTETGDPVKAARCLIELANMNEPPRNVLLGSDAVMLAAAAAGQLRDELASHEALSRLIDF